MEHLRSYSSSLILPARNSSLANRASGRSWDSLGKIALKKTYEAQNVIPRIVMCQMAATNMGEGEGNSLLRMYRAIEILHFPGVSTPRYPNSNAQQRTEKHLTTHGFQFPKSARLPTPIKTSACARKVNPDAIRTTDVYALVLFPPPQKTWQGAVASTPQGSLPNGRTLGLKPA